MGHLVMNCCSCMLKVNWFYQPAVLKVGNFPTQYLIYNPIFDQDVTILLKIINCARWGTLQIMCTKLESGEYIGPEYCEIGSSLIGHRSVFPTFSPTPDIFPTGHLSHIIVL